MICIGQYGFINHDPNCKNCKIRKFYIEKKRKKKIFEKDGYQCSLFSYIKLDSKL